MKVVCPLSQNEFTVDAQEIKFLEQISPLFADSLFQIPPPSCSPQSRLQQMLAFRNERALYQNECSHSKKKIISVFSPDSPYKVFSKDIWWDDFWDACDFGIDFDFSKTFTENFKSLLKAVPKISLYQKNCENSDYNNYTHNLKNCYLNFGSTNSEDCHFSKNVKNSFKCFDSLSIFNCEACYEGVFSNDCFNCQFFKNCLNCSDSFLIEDCTGCKNCALSYGLISAEYCIFNKKVSPEEFAKFKAEWFPLTQEKLEYLKKRYTKFLSSIPVKAFNQISCENSTGHALLNSSEVHHSYVVRDG